MSGEEFDMIPRVRGLALALVSALSIPASAAPPREGPRVEPLLKAMSRDANSAEPAAAERLRVIITGQDPILIREQAVRILASTPRPALAATLKALLTAKEPLSLRAAAAMTLYQWDRGEAALAAVLAVQAEGAPVRSAFRTGFYKGSYVYDTHALGVFHKGVNARLSPARIDAAAGLVELGESPDLARKTLLDVLDIEPRWDDRLSVLTTIAMLPAQPWFTEIWAAAARDRDPHVRDAARRHL